MKRYFKCCKCGAIAHTEDESLIVNGKLDIACTAPMPSRTSGICAGSFTEEIPAPKDQ